MNCDVYGATLSAQIQPKASKLIGRFFKCRWTKSRSILRKPLQDVLRQQSGMFCNGHQSSPIDHASHLLKPKLPKKKQELKTAVKAWQSTTPGNVNTLKLKDFQLLYIFILLYPVIDN